ncbi:MAG: hypothetical protein B6D55_06935 [Candidatus Omnitrophica bacterium 4484_70.2]|nr:MAG: hypothetical protein B6D55_06935 [Candidatus Omnitrophica bacterium 4484_70.2]
MKKKIWVVIPAYNEEKTIGAILDDLKRKDISVLVIDDGSQDSTAEVVKEKGVPLIRNEKNLGKGLALKKGFDYLFKNEDFDYVVTMDADRQHSPEDLDKFLEAAENNEDFVVGNRMQNPEGMPKIRVFTNKLMSWLISKIAKQRIPDTQCGFRLIKRKVLEKLNIETNKFQIESEIIIKAARLGILIKSIPIRSIYYEKALSKIHPLLDTLRFIRFLFRLYKKKTDERK